MENLSVTSKNRNHYSLNSIMKENANFNIIIGDSYIGESYIGENTISVLELMVKRYLKDGSQGVILRRWGIDFKEELCKTLFDSVLSTGILKDTEWDGIDYVFMTSTWILYKNDKELNKKIYDKKPIAFEFSLSSIDFHKMNSYKEVSTILFDEFIAKDCFYIQDEFDLFMEAIQKIVRDRGNIDLDYIGVDVYNIDVDVFMCANALNKSTPYFKEMKINIDKMKEGDIDVYTYDNSDVKVAVEYYKRERNVF